MTTPTLQQERRLTTRVLTVWKKIAGKGFPKRSQVDPRAFGSEWGYCLLIDVDPKPERSRFAFVGANLRDPKWRMVRSIRTTSPALIRCSLASAKPRSANTLPVLGSC